jgi:hypothetical protein
MSLSGVLSAARLIGPSTRGALCPACRRWNGGTTDRRDHAETERSADEMSDEMGMAMPLAPSRSVGQ